MLVNWINVFCFLLSFVSFLSQLFLGRFRSVFFVYRLVWSFRLSMFIILSRSRHLLFLLPFQIRELLTKSVGSIWWFRRFQCRRIKRLGAFSFGLAVSSADGYPYLCTQYRTRAFLKVSLTMLSTKYFFSSVVPSSVLPFAFWNVSSILSSMTGILSSVSSAAIWYLLSLSSLLPVFHSWVRLVLRLMAEKSVLACLFVGQFTIWQWWQSRVARPFTLWQSSSVPPQSNTVFSFMSVIFVMGFWLFEMGFASPYGKKQGRLLCIQRPIKSFCQNSPCIFSIPRLLLLPISSALPLSCHGL